MLIATVNSGSTSIKLSAFAGSEGADAEHAVVRETHEGHALEPEPLLSGFLTRLGAAPGAVAHRVVHGGTRFARPVKIDAEVETALEALGQLAPLHNPVALRWIRAARSLLPPGVPQVAAFDTAFFSALPRVAAEYALPPHAGAALGVRRYGFHGLAHAGMWQQWRERRGEGGRLVTLQLGGGCSVAAIADGRPLDTSMGFSPLEGLMMATRSGDVDPAVLPYLATRLGIGIGGVLAILERESGLLGVSGSSADMRALLADPGAQARFAVDLFCYRARKCIGAYLSVLGGCDGIAFGGGIGEHAAEIRAAILAPLGWAGVRLDAAANAAARGGAARISSVDSPIGVEVLPVDEERALAEAARECLGR